MRFLRRTLALAALLLACDPAPRPPPTAELPAPRPVSPAPAPGPRCEQAAPDGLLGARDLDGAAPAPAAVAAARPDRHGAVRRALRLFPVRDVAAETAALSALRLDSDGQGRGDAVETAL